MIPHLDSAVAASQPDAPTPSARQLRRYRRDFYGFLHFSTDTSTDALC